MDFGEALDALKSGSCVAREGWNGKGMYISIREAHGGLRDRYIEMYTADKRLIPWLASQTDMLADDWITVTWAS